jgi:hypothetical protein
MMNPEIKSMWVAALRSGDYQQGQGQLRNHNDYFCCLGVLCDLMPTSNGGWYTVEDDEDLTSIYEFDGMTELLPDSVMMWANLDSYNPRVLVADGLYVNLSTLNEERGYTFARIADAIEESSL